MNAKHEQESKKVTIYDAIKQQHDKHRTLLGLLVKTQGDSRGRQELFDKVRDEMAHHAKAEDLTLYAAMIAETSTVDEARHSVAEHKELDDLLKKLEETDYSSSGWVVTAEKLKERAEHHMAEEENEIFAAAEKVISAADAERLATEFLEYFETVTA